jgi:hypothetical protein
LDPVAWTQIDLPGDLEPGMFPTWILLLGLDLDLTEDFGKVHLQSSDDTARRTYGKNLLVLEYKVDSGHESRFFISRNTKLIQN